MTENGIQKLKLLEQTPGIEVRIKACDFKELLLDNTAVVAGGKNRYIQGIFIGEGVYRIRLLPEGWDPFWGNIKLEPGDDWMTKVAPIEVKKTKPCC